MTFRDLQHDVREAWRSLSRAKAFSAAAVLTLALGIAATTVMFTLVHGVLLRPLPVRDQDRVIVAWKELRASGFTHYPFGNTAIDDVARHSRLFEAVAGVDANGVAGDLITDGQVTHDLDVALVTGEFFSVLGVVPALGRSLTRADDVEGAEPVIVISHGLWQRLYAGSPEVIGRRVTLSQQRFAIVGVMPRDLDYPNGVEAWRPTHTVGTTSAFGDAARSEIDLLARLRPGVTIEQATSELAMLTRQFESQAAGGTRDLTPVVQPLADVVVGNVRRALLAMAAAVALVLLIASANAANLLLMRGEARRHELAIRHALGAGAGRIARYLLAESLLLTLMATATAFVAAWWSVRGLLTLLPDGLPRLESVRVDAPVVWFTAIAALTTWLLAGVGPALAAGRIDLPGQLASGGRGVKGPASRWRRVLVVTQVALAVTIVAAAGLLTRTVQRLQSVDVGLAADRLVFVEVSLPNAKYAERARHEQFLDDVMARLGALPSVAAVTPINVKPFSGDGGWDVPRFTAEGQSAEQAAANPSLNLESIHPGYFRTFEIPVVRGRAFASSDREGMLSVAILSDEVAARTWPGQDPIGKRIKMGGADNREPWLTIVGVAAATRYRELARPRPTVYLPAAQFLMTAQTLVLRTQAPLDLIAPLVREQIRGVDPDVRVARTAAFTELLAEPLARPRFNAFVLGVFGLAALLLTTVGLYAVIAAHVRQREREIAVRVALGATVAHVRRLVLGEALGLAAVGAAIGLAASVGASRSLRAMLFGVDALDPATLLGAALLLMILAVLASYVPMRRAVRADAVEALRG